MPPATSPSPARGPFALRPLGALARAPDPRYSDDATAALSRGARLDLVVLSQHASNTPIDDHRRRCFAAGVDPDRVATIDLTQLGVYGSTAGGEELAGFSAGAGGWGSRALAALLGYISPPRPGKARAVNTAVVRDRVAAWHAARVVDIRGKVAWLFVEAIAALDGRGRQGRPPVAWRWGAPASGSPRVGEARRGPDRDRAGSGDRRSIDRSSITCPLYMGPAAGAPGSGCARGDEEGPSGLELAAPAQREAVEVDGLDEVLERLAAVKPSYAITVGIRISVAALVGQYGAAECLAALARAEHVDHPLPWLTDTLEGRARDARRRAEAVARAEAERRDREADAEPSELERRLLDSIPAFEGLPRMLRLDRASRESLVELVARFGEAKVWQAVPAVRSYRTPVQGLEEVLICLHGPKTPQQVARGAKLRRRLEEAEAAKQRAQRREEEEAALAERAEAERRRIAVLLADVRRRPMAQERVGGFDEYRRRSRARAAAEEAWRRARDELRARVTVENFQTYFAPLRFVRGGERELVLRVDDPFLRDWVQLHYQDLLDGLPGLDGRAVVVEAGPLSPACRPPIEVQPAGDAGRADPAPERERAAPARMAALAAAAGVAA